jgi:hypothetical protein
MVYLSEVENPFHIQGVENTFYEFPNLRLCDFVVSNGSCHEFSPFKSIVRNIRHVPISTTVLDVCFMLHLWLMVSMLAGALFLPPVFCFGCVMERWFKVFVF